MPRGRGLLPTGTPQLTLTLTPTPTPTPTLTLTLTLTLTQAFLSNAARYPVGIWTIPELAFVGLTYEAAKGAPHSLQTLALALTPSLALSLTLSLTLTLTLTVLVNYEAGGGIL